MTMDAPAPEANDVFSLSDHLLAERLQFVKEVRTVLISSSKQVK
jgi:hypothetical protein